MSQPLRLIIVTGVTVLGIGGAFFILHPRSSHQLNEAAPFADRPQLMGEIAKLPGIEFAGPRLLGDEWSAYVSLARRLRVSDSGVVLSALRQLTGTNALDSLQLNIKVAILLRVCFYCPAGTRPPVAYGGWVSNSARQAGRANFDANWPVGYRAGRFYLTDSLDGYLGRPYDPAADYQWRLTNCRWREL